MLLPGDLSVHRTLPVFLSMAKKAGGVGRREVDVATSTPLDVQTNSMSPTQQIEQLHMLCCETPSCAIMSNPR